MCGPRDRESVRQRLGAAESDEPSRPGRGDDDQRGRRQHGQREAHVDRQVGGHGQQDQDCGR
jgi:hypothetical protein